MPILSSVGPALSDKLPKRTRTDGYSRSTGDTVERFVTWNGLDTMQTVDRAVVEMRKYGFRPRVGLESGWGRVVVDTIGIGSGVNGRLRQLGYDVEEFNGGALPVTDRKQFLNRRSASYWSVKTMLEEDRIAVPQD